MPWSWELSHDNFALDHALESFRLGSLAWELSLGTFRLDTFIWERSLAMHFVWGLSFGNFSLGISGFGNWAPEAG